MPLLPIVAFFTSPDWLWAFGTYIPPLSWDLFTDVNHSGFLEDRAFRAVNLLISPLLTPNPPSRLLDFLCSFCRLPPSFFLSVGRSFPRS